MVLSGQGAPCYFAQVSCDLPSPQKNGHNVFVACSTGLQQRKLMCSADDEAESHRVSVYLMQSCVAVGVIEVDIKSRVICKQLPNFGLFA